ncbi:hypothetical protein V5O48_003826 [Marasmius crinis-equi]|uniref:Cytochrome P450 n=1 Tax=Marasmius crinis-equi TaxID=585013 RepID=A0ABR3FRT6_9AGAR
MPPSYLLISASVFSLLHLYRVLSHPLRRYPGPLLASLTVWYKAYYDIVKDGGFLEHLERLHGHYGPVVRIGPNELHFANPEAYGEIYYVGSKFTKDPKFYKAFDQSHSSFGLTHPGEAKRRREQLGPLFSRSAILRIEGVVQDKVDRLIERIALESKKGPVNLFLAFRAASMDVIMSYCFAESFDALGTPNFDHPILTSILNSITVIWLLVYLPFVIPLVNHGPQRLLKAVVPMLKGYFDLFQHFSKRIDEAWADPARLKWQDHETVFQRLLDCQDDDRPSKRSLMDEAVTLLGAGTETTGGTLTMAIYHIYSNSLVRERLRREVDLAWPDDGTDLKYRELEKLEYLTAVIKESMRCADGVVTPMPRVVHSKATICGFDVPPQTTVSAGVTFVHRNPKLYPDPLEFRPERWLDPAMKDIESRYFLPFSKGPRTCLGVNLAWCELYLILAHIVRKLDVEIYETGPEDFQFRQYWLPIYRGRQMRGIITPRTSKPNTY